MILVIFAFLIACAIPYFVRQWQMERHRELMASQFRAALQNMVHALRIGVSFNQALAYTAKESPEPMASEWNYIMQAQRLGQPLAEALNTFVQRVPVKEVAWFSTAVQLTQSSGGSLADVLETLSETLQERQTLREKVGALTAQGKVSGILMAIIPYALLGAMSVITPEMSAPFFNTTIGQLVLTGITISIAIGGFIIKKIVTIEVS